MYQNTIEHFRKYVDISDGDINIIAKYLKPIKLKRKDFLLKEGQVCRANYFVEKGCLRMYFINEKGAEQISQFAIENWWIADYFSLLDNKNSDYYIQAIEKSEILTFDYSQQNALFKDVPHFERYFRIVSERQVAASQHRNRLLYDLSKEEFYQHFSSAFPEFMQRVPQYMIASYLGLSPEYLSEIKSKKSNNRII